MRTLIVVVVLLTIVANPVLANRAAQVRIKGQYAGCVTQGELDRFYQAINAKDEATVQALLAGRCHALKGERYTLQKRSGRVSRITVWSLGRDLYVPTEALK